MNVAQSCTLLYPQNCILQGPESLDPTEDFERLAECNSAVFTTYHVAGSKTLRYERNVHWHVHQ